MTTRQHPTAPAVCWRILVSGRVQGVGFRYATVDEARRLGLVGWVRNTRDGQVEIVAQGHHDSMRRLLAWCRSGPPGARVTGVEQTESSVDESLSGFHMTY